VITGEENFNRKIPAYLDGLLPEEERLEFEAFVGANPVFAREFRQKEADYEGVKRRIPDLRPSGEQLEQMEVETREIIQNLFKDEDAGTSDKLAQWWRGLF